MGGYNILSKTGGVEYHRIERRKMQQNSPIQYLEASEHQRKP